MFEKKRPTERGFNMIRMVLMSWILIVDFLDTADICCFAFLSSETVLSDALTPTNQPMAAAARQLRGCVTCVCVGVVRIIKSKVQTVCL